MDPYRFLNTLQVVPGTQSRDTLCLALCEVWVSYRCPKTSKATVLPAREEQCPRRQQGSPTSAERPARAGAALHASCAPSHSPISATRCHRQS